MAASIPPAKSTWLSFSKIISNNPIRWLTPPPILTASFSTIRRPGVVLRVSNTRVFVPSRALTYLRVVVAIPLMRCMTLSIKRSVCNKDCTFPSTTKSISPFFTSAPSWMNVVIFSSGSNVWKIRSAISTPANTPSSFTISWLFPISVAGMQHKVVWSPSPISSANARRISSAISCSFVSCTFMLLLIYDL